MILVVDDDPAIREFMSVILSGLDYEVLHAADAESGMRLFQLLQPRLIITDIILPDQDGFRYIHEIRKRDRAVPIIAMTSNVHGRAKEYLAQCLFMGANATMQKPLTIEMVKQAVTGLLPPTRGQAQEDMG